MRMNAPFSFSSSAKLFQLFKSLTSLTTSGSLFNPAEKKIRNFSYLDDIVAHQKKKIATILPRFLYSFLVDLG